MLQDHPGVQSYHQHPKSHSRQELFCFFVDCAAVVTADVFKLKADASILINY